MLPPNADRERGSLLTALSFTLTGVKAVRDALEKRDYEGAKILASLTLNAGSAQLEKFEREHGPK